MNMNVETIMMQVELSAMNTAARVLNEMMAVHNTWTDGMTAVVNDLCDYHGWINLQGEPYDIMVGAWYRATFDADFNQIEITKK